MSTYTDLGKLIEQHRPYGNVGVLPDLTDPATFRRRSVPLLSDRARVDVFGPLWDWGKAGSKGLLEVKTENDINGNPMVVAVEPVPGQYVEAGAFHVMLASGEEVRITKGIHIPYQYADRDGNQVWASILVLYNGVGNP